MSRGDVQRPRRFPIQLEASDHQRLIRRASSHGLTVSEYIRRATLLDLAHASLRNISARREAVQLSERLKATLGALSRAESEVGESTQAVGQATRKASAATVSFRAG